jgi:hypothetical protein
MMGTAVTAVEGNSSAAGNSEAIAVSVLNSMVEGYWWR